MTPDDFKREIAAAVKAYDKFCIVLELPSCDVEKNIVNLVGRAIKLYDSKDRNRTAAMSMNSCLTVQLSDAANEPLPRCSIYFNLHSFYVEEAKQAAKAKEKAKK